MTVEWTREQQDSLVREMVKRPVIRGVELACAIALDWFNREVLPEIEERHKGERERAFRKGRQFAKESDKDAFERGRADALREIEAERTRTASTSETRHWALGHAVRHAAKYADADVITVTNFAQDFDAFITGADQ